MAMMKVEITIDDEKIKAEGKHKLEDVYYSIRCAFEEADLPEIKAENGVSLAFTEKGRSSDFARFGSVINSLYESEWFRPYITKYTWYSYDGHTEDIIKIRDNFEVKGI